MCLDKEHGVSSARILLRYQGYQGGENPQETGLAGILLKVTSATQRQTGQGWGLLREADRPREILMEV